MEMMQSGLNRLDEILHKCIRCGLCLPVCPTFDLTYNEQSSPRGRIRLMRSVEAGELNLGEEFINEMYFCLDCQACQTACPAGVEYGSLIEEARAKIAQTGSEPLSLRLLKKVFLRGILASQARMKWFARLLRWYQRCGLKETIDRSTILNLFSSRLHDRHSMLPLISDKFFDDGIEEVIQPNGPVKRHIAFFTGCIMNVSFANVHSDMLSVLRANGCEVLIPRGQECCGSLHGHHGDVEMARKLAQKNIDIMNNNKFDTLIVNSAGCSAFMKNYGILLAGDPIYADLAKRFSSKVKDINEFLVGLEIEESLHPLRSRVTYHEACHLVHAQKISQQPRRLIQAIPGIEFVELPESTWCCGSAGIYNITHFDDSMKFLKRKIHHLASTSADIVVTSNPGCHLQLQFGIWKFGFQIEVLHPVSLLRRSLNS